MQRVMFVLASALVACTQPPEVSVVDPSEGPAGSAVRIDGQGFEPTVSVLLRSEGQNTGGQAVQISTISATTLSGKVPAELAPGAYTLVVAQRGVEVLVPGGFTVKEPVKDTPCGHLYTANTQVSLGTQQVMIDRFYKDDRRETLRVDFDDVERVEFEKVAVQGGGLCNVIYVKTTDGRRLRFADDLDKGEDRSGLDLKARAYKLGQEIGKAVDVTREDAAPPAADPAPQGEAAGG